MKVITTHTTTLKPINLPFSLILKLKPKRNRENIGWWFTPTGKGMIYFGNLHLISLGATNDKDDADIIKMMKKYKTDILTDGRAYYTRGMNGLCEIGGAFSIIHAMNEYWHNRQDDWDNLYEAKKEFIDELKPLAVIDV